MKTATPKKTAIVCLLFTASCLLPPANSFSQTWQWAQSAGGSSYDAAYSVSTDASGNSYVTGGFASTSITFGSTVLNNAGPSNNNDMFIVKYDASGNVLWAKSAGGNSNDYAYSISTDALGNSYVAGSFKSNSITFGSIILNNAGLYADMYIVKYDANGTVLWAKSAGGSSVDEAYSVSVDASGNSYVSGWFYSDSITFGTTTLTNADTTGNTMDIFIVKYDANGNILWAQGAGGNSNDKAYSVSADVFGNSYVAGSFASSSITFGSTVLNSIGGNDVFLVKYDANGTVLWAKSAGGSSADEAYSVRADTSGNSYVAGFFQDSSITFGSTVLNSTGGDDIFLVKYDASGNVLWAKSAGGSSHDEAYSVCADAWGNSYVAGSFASSSITFNSIVLNNTGVFADIFLVKYDANGNALWAKNAACSGLDYAYSVNADALGNSYVAGWFSNFPITFGSTVLNSAGSSDMFVAKLSGITATEEINNANNLIFYPNPTSGKIHVAVSLGSINTIEVYNLYGEKIYSISNDVLPAVNAPISYISLPNSILSSGANQSPVSIDISSHPKGIYFVKVLYRSSSFGGQSADKIYTKKVLLH